jgi:LysW-gamma-L-lysine carboxypeptidase
MAAYGPGDSKLDHTSQEHIDLDEYLTAVSVLKNALEHFMRNG